MQSTSRREVKTLITSTDMKFLLIPMLDLAGFYQTRGSTDRLYTRAVTPQLHPVEAHKSAFTFVTRDRASLSSLFDFTATPHRTSFLQRVSYHSGMNPHTCSNIAEVRLMAKTLYGSNYKKHCLVNGERWLPKQKLLSLIDRKVVKNIISNPREADVVKIPWVFGPCPVRITDTNAYVHGVVAVSCNGPGDISDAPFTISAEPRYEGTHFAVTTSFTVRGFQAVQQGDGSITFLPLYPNV